MLNLAKPAERWMGDFLIRYLSDNRRIKFISDVGYDTNANDQKNLDKLEKYYQKAIDYVITDWKDITLDGKLAAECNRKNKLKLLENHRGIALELIIKALNPLNFGPDVESLLGKFEGLSNTVSHGNDQEGHLPIAADA